MNIIEKECKPIMPTIETVTIYTGKLGKTQHQYFNVTLPVGTGMPNHFGDVTVIQALLNYIGSNKATAGGSGIRAADMPMVTGVFDTKTVNAIAAFQPLQFYVAFEHGWQNSSRFIQESNA